MLKRQIKKFFEDNPNEELTMEDIAIKFNAPLNCVKARVREMWQPGGDLKRFVVVRLRKPSDEWK